MMICNKTPLSLFTFSSVDLEEEPFQVVIAKGIFDIVPGSFVELSPAQEPIQEDEAAPFKLGTDIVCHATAYAPTGERARSWRVRLAIGECKKSLTVTGPRAWVHAPLLGWSLSPIVPVRKVPIRYELAFGGEGYAPNPAGMGHVDPRRADKTRALAAPQILAADGRPPVFGEPYPVENFGAIPPSWLPRRDATYFDAFSVAHPDLVTRGYLSGHETVTLENLHPEHARLTFRLPDLLVAAAILDRAGFRYGAPLRLDTVSIDVERMRVVLIWRASPPLYRDGIARVDLAMQRRTS